MKTALITGITGQDGSYLAELLISQGYMVHGIIVGHEDLRNLREIKDHPNLELVDGELLDQGFINAIVRELKPDRLFNLAGQSFVPLSWKQPVFTADFNGLTVTRLLEAIRLYSPETRFYQASSSEMFGNVSDGPLNETSPFSPCSPYAAAKVYGHYVVNVYRESYNLFACSGILFNHESPRRGGEFVTQKIARGVARIAAGSQEKIELGNPFARRDWGHALDYVRAMFLMLEHAHPCDYVIATGEAHTVEEFCREAFQYIGIHDWRKYVGFMNPSLMRPKDVDCLIGDSKLARMTLGWSPSFTFSELVHDMVDAEI